MVASRRSPWLLRPLALVLVCSLLVDFADGRSSGKSKPNKGREKASKAKDSSKKGGKKKPAAKSLDVTIPEGARPGDRLEFVTPDNQQFYTEVPKGMSPGQQMRLQLPKGVRKARMKKFFPPKRRTRKSAGKRGAGKGRGGGASAGPTKPAPTMVGIDFGSEHIKIAVEAPRKDGDPFEDPVVLNMQGGRTTPNVLALQDDEIFFGDVAIPLLPKLPNSSYVHIKQLLGRRMDEPKPFGLAAHTEPSGGPAWFTAMGLHYDFVADENRSTVRLPAGSTTGAGADGPASPRTLGVEELTALTLVKCKELVNARLHSKAGQAGASHFAISVPVWFTKLQRSAMSHAARLAGFENVAIVNDNTALAFKYTLTRNPRDILADKGKDKKARYTNKDTHTVLLYDVGSTGATASLVTINIGTKTKGRKMSVVETIDIRAVAWEERVGGRSFDRRLAQIMARRYNAAERKGGGAADVLADRRAMALLLREAAKTKEKLSANTEIAVEIEGLPTTIPGGLGALSTVMTREELEAATADLVEALLVPVRRVLDETGVPKASIDAVTTVGGGSRVPVLQDKLKKLLRREKLDNRISGDDSVAEGLAAYGASNLQGKKGYLRDISVVGNRFGGGLTPTRAQMVQPLDPRDGSGAWKDAAQRVRKLTAKAASLAAHQQALSDFEALLFRWEGRL